ncbi:alcohol dehydrogenase-like protein [Rhizobium sp. PP-WC-2G-219]|nr:alcohol dehydrogenase-like protein [Rhizobium sp. PP-WC-2G-219]
MAEKMQAAVVVAFGQPLILREYNVPSVGPGQILVKTEPCGVCHTDLHAAQGDWPVKPTPPFIPGHEGIGIVVVVGHGRDDLTPSEDWEKRWQPRSGPATCIGRRQYRRCGI